MEREKIEYTAENDSLYAFIKKYELLAFLIVISVAAIMLRIMNFKFASNDYNVFLNKWYTLIKEGGGFKALKNLRCDYAPAYLYFMALFTYLPIRDLYAIKGLSVIFDFVLAIYSALIIYRIKKSKTDFCVAYTAVLFLPNVFFNSSVWGQCDSIFTAFTVMCLYYILKEKSLPAMICYGFAFSFKLQSIFFLPIIIIAVLKEKIKWYSVFYSVGVFFVMGIPALILGMPIFYVYGVYGIQMGEYTKLTMNTPNIYNWFLINEKYYSEEVITAFSSSTVLFAFGATGVCMLPLYRRNFNKNDDRVWLLAGAFFASLMPFVLPHMHERYWYLSDILALLVIIAMPKKWFGSFAVIISSLYVVCNYLFVVDTIDLNLLAVFMLAGIIYQGVTLMQTVNDSVLIKEN